MFLQTGGAVVSCQRTNTQKVTASDANVGFRRLGELGSKTFLFREPEFDPVPELMILRQKVGLLVIVSGEGSTST